MEDSERKESLLSKFSCHVLPPQTPAAIKHFEKVLNSIGFNHQEEVTSLECIGDGPLSFNVKIGMKLYSKTRNIREKTMTIEEFETAQRGRIHGARFGL